MHPIQDTSAVYLHVNDFFFGMYSTLQDYLRVAQANKESIDNPL